MKESTIILSGYQGVAIWFIPFPLGNYGAQTQKFREIELTGTKFTSIIKAEVVMVPIVLLATFLYSSYIWKTRSRAVGIISVRPGHVAPARTADLHLVHRDAARRDDRDAGPDERHVDAGPASRATDCGTGACAPPTASG